MIIKMSHTKPKRLSPVGKSCVLGLANHPVLLPTRTFGLMYLLIALDVTDPTELMFAVH